MDVSDDIIATAGIGLVLVSMALPWFSIRWTVNEVSPTSTSTLIGAYSPTGLVVVVLTMSSYGHFRRTGSNPVSGLVAVGAGAIALLGVLNPGLASNANATVTSGIGVYVGIAGAILLALGSFANPVTDTDRPLLE